MKFQKGDVVKLGPTALEKHYVLRVWGDGTVQVRQNTTGKIRNVKASRCVRLYRVSDPIKAVEKAMDEAKSARPAITITAEYADSHWCDKCGDFLRWCPDYRNKISS